MKNQPWWLVFFIGEKRQTDLSFAVFIPPSPSFHVDTNAK
jgi:hypothetical protein